MEDEKDDKMEAVSAADENLVAESPSDLTVENVRLHTEAQTRSRNEPTDSDQVLRPLKTPSTGHLLAASKSGSHHENIDTEITLTESAEFPKTKPLPPIGSNLSESNGKDEERLKDKALPTILSFKRESISGDDVASVKSTDSKSSKRTVSFKEGESPHPHQKINRNDIIAKKEITKKTGVDGKEYIMVSLDTQTEWSWLEDLKAMGKSPSRVMTPITAKPEDEKEDVLPEAKAKSAVTTPSGVTQDDQENLAVYPQPSVDDIYGIPLLELSSDSDFSEDDDTVSQPPTLMDEETDIVQGIGPPQILQYKRESDDKVSDVKDASQNDENLEVKSFEEMFNAPCEYCGNPVKPFPTLEQQESQPPEDLYCCETYREFVHFTLTHPENDAYFEDKTINVAPHPPHGSKLARKAAKERAAQREASRIRAVMRMRERELQRQQAAAAAMTSGVAPTNFFSFARQMKTINYQLSSQRCLEEGWTVRIPSPLQDEESEAEIFIAEPLSEFGEDEDYQFVDLMDQSLYDETGGDTYRTTDMKTKSLSHKEAESFGKKGRGTKPSESDAQHGPDDSADEADRYRGKKTAKPVHRKGKRTHDPSEKGDGRQRKKGDRKSQEKKPEKSYSLLRAEDTPSDEEWQRRLERESPRKLALKAMARARKRVFRQWFYPDGSKFLTVFPDGSGNVFYASGNLAVVITRFQRGKLCYVVHDDKKDTEPYLLAVFEPTGFAGCYFTNGQLRLYLDQFGGVEHDFQGGRKRRWSWKDQITHVHAPPFQPICFSLNNKISVRVMGQANIALTFRDGNRSCRFNVGAKLKLVNPSLIPPKEVDEEALYINEVKAKVETLLNRVSNLLKFPKSPKLETMKPPQHVTSMMERNEKMRKQMERSISLKEKKAPAVVVN